MNMILVGVAFAVTGGAALLLLNLRRGTFAFGFKGSRFASISISIVPPIIVCVFGAWVAIAETLGPTAKAWGPPARVVPCAVRRPTAK